MTPQLKKILPIVAVVLLGCCLLSAAALWLAPTDKETAGRDDASQATQIVAEIQKTATEEASPTSTDLPVRPPATATARPPTSTPNRTRAPILAAVETATMRPTRTPRPTNTPRPAATATSQRPEATATRLATATSTAPPTATPLPGEIGTVTGVIDGDTIIVSVDGVTYRVRYIGIDTPETGDPCGREATAANAALVDGRTVRMVKDVSETDRYDRLLRYVYVEDTFVNGELVADGWAEAVDYPPDTAMADTLHSLEARGVGQGCALVAGAIPTVPPRAPVVTTVPLAPPPAVPPTAAPVPQPTAPPSGNCDPAYPTVCIPPPPPDLDCGDIPYRRFQVLPPDPHNFDGNSDGVGCESG